MTQDTDQDNRRRWRRWALVAGVILGLACHAAPEEYRGACEVVSTVALSCSGG